MQFLSGEYSDFNQFMENKFGYGWQLEKRKEGKLVSNEEYMQACSEWNNYFDTCLKPISSSAKLQKLAQRQLASEESRNELRITIGRSNRDSWYRTHGYIVSGNKTIALVDVGKNHCFGSTEQDYGYDNCRFITTFQPYRVSAMLDEIERLQNLLKENGIDPDKVEKL